MSTTKTIIMAALMTTVTMSAFGQQGPASAQPGGQDDDIMEIQNSAQPGRNGPLSEKKREEVRNKIDAIRIWRMTEALKLDANTSAKLSSILSVYGHQRRNIHREQAGMIRILKSVIRSPIPDESKIKPYLEKLEKNNQAMQELMNNEMRGLKDILTIEQQARYIVFQHEFMREMRGMIGSAHGKRGKNGMGVGGSGRGGSQGQMRGGTGQGGTVPSPQN